MRDYFLSLCVCMCVCERICSLQNFNILMYYNMMYIFSPKIDVRSIIHLIQNLHALLAYVYTDLLRHTTQLNTHLSFSVASCHLVGNDDDNGNDDDDD